MNAFVRTTTAVTMFNAGVKVKYCYFFYYTNSNE